MDNDKLDSAVRKFDALCGRFDKFCEGRKDADAGVRAREAGESKPFVTPQVENPGFKPVNKLGRM